MLRFVLQRLLALIPLLLIVSALVFSLVLLIPGDPAYQLAGEDATPAEVEAIREAMGLNDPLPVRYARWLGGVVTGDLGTSLFSDQPVLEVIVERLPVTVSLAVVAILIALAISIPAGIVAGTRPGRLGDRAVTLGSSSHLRWARAASASGSADGFDASRRRACAVDGVGPGGVAGLSAHC